MAGTEPIDARRKGRKRTGNLLLDEYPLIILPKLAVAIGLNEAIVLQQVHYWLVHYEQARDESHFKDGHWWIYNTVAEWTGQFPFWSYPTVKRALTSLRKPYTPKDKEKEYRVARGPLLIATAKHNRAGFDKTLWYTIDYDEVDRLTQRVGQNEPIERIKMTQRVDQNDPTSGSERPNRAGQNAPLDQGKMSQPIPETTRDHPETTPETTAAAARIETVTATRDRLLAVRQADGPVAAAAILLDDFDISAPNDELILAKGTHPDTIRAWILHALTQSGLTDPDRFVTKQLLKHREPPDRCLTWARLTPEEWQALWRAEHYGNCYLAALSPETRRVAHDWARDFAGVFPDGPFGDGEINSVRLRLALDQLGEPCPRFDVHVRHGAITLVADTDETLAWLLDHEGEIRDTWQRQGVFHAVEIAGLEEDGGALDFPGVSVDESTKLQWSSALGELQLQMTQATFDTWLRGSRVLKHGHGAFVVGVRSGYAKDWLEHRLLTTIERTLKRLTRETCEVHFVTPLEWQEMQALEQV